MVWTAFSLSLCPFSAGTCSPRQLPHQNYQQPLLNNHQHHHHCHNSAFTTQTINQTRRWTESLLTMEPMTHRGKFSNTHLAIRFSLISGSDAVYPDAFCFVFWYVLLDLIRLINYFWAINRRIPHVRWLNSGRPFSSALIDRATAACWFRSCTPIPGGCCPLKIWRMVVNCCRCHFCKYTGRVRLLEMGRLLFDAC